MQLHFKTDNSPYGVSCIPISSAEAQVVVRQEDWAVAGQALHQAPTGMKQGQVGQDVKQACTTKQRVCIECLAALMLGAFTS